MRHSFCRIRSVVFRRSVWMSFFCPCPISGGVVPLTLRKRGHRKIISHSAGHSVVTGIWAAKKAGTSMCADRSQKDSLIPLWCWFHIHVTGFEIQSRNCQLRFLIADSSKQFRSSGISFSHTAGVYGAKPYSQILWRYVIGCGSHKRIFHYTEWNKCLSILSEKVLNIFFGKWEYYLITNKNHVRLSLDKRTEPTGCDCSQACRLCALCVWLFGEMLFAR